MKSLLSAVLGIMLLAPHTAAAGQPSDVILVLDASGSMARKIRRGGPSKMAIAREVIGDLVRDLDGNTRLGLTVYGHRRPSDCGDIESLIPVSGVDPRSFMAKVDALTPNGKTPLSMAVKQAAEELDYTKKKASVILISDGRETCRMDPCAVGTALKKAGADFTVHVVSFDVTDAEGIAQLKCLAKNTGGTFYSAKDSKELRKALGTAVKAAVSERNVTLTVVPRKGAEPFESAAFWVYALDEDGTPSRQHVAYSGWNPGRLTLEPGDYMVKAVVGKGSAKSPLRVKAGKKIKKTIVLAVGKAELTAIPAEGAKPFKSVAWWVHSLDDGKPSASHVAYSGWNPGKFTLPSGDYLVKVKVGKSRREARFSVETDRTTSKTIIVSAGGLSLTAVPRKGAKKFKSSTWWIYALDEDGAPEKNHVAYSSWNPGKFTLEAGNYLAKLEVGKAKTTIRVRVKANRMVRRTVVLSAGYVELTAVPDLRVNPFKSATWWVYSLDEEGNPSSSHLAYSSWNPGKFTLSAGRYFLKAKVGHAKTETYFDVTADKTLKKEIVVRAGYAILTALERKGGKKVPSVRWWVYKIDENGHPSSSRSAYGSWNPAKFTLQEGRYSVTLKAGGKEKNALFKVTAGDRMRLSIPMR